MTTSSPPNIILITTDQQRGDCLGIDGHPVLQTPNLDWLARSGTRFRRGYAECPSCVPARRTLMSGQAPAANGMVGYKDFVAWNPAHTMAGELGRAGYQTEMIGKLHLTPRHKRYGFDHMSLADSTQGEPDENAYVDWLQSMGHMPPRAGVAHGVSANGWVGRPSHLPEEQSHTFWCVSQAMDFLVRRDPSVPFFLNISMIDPHPPLTPPQFYYDRYAALDLPPPVIGDWVDTFDAPQRGLAVDAERIRLDNQAMHYARAAYYGMINHIDDQVGRLFNFLRRMKLFNSTFFVFTSDHGEMLGDHNLYRKTFAYEASARVPFIMHAPPDMEYPSEIVSDVPVGLQDIMPTLLELAGAQIPDTLTGESLLPIMQGDESGARSILHGEHSGCYAYEDGVHFLVDKRTKYIWYSQTGREHLFDLHDDPDEEQDLALGADSERQLAPWRTRLAEVLSERPEGFSDGEQLFVGKPHHSLVGAHEGPWTADY